MQRGMPGRMDQSPNQPTRHPAPRPASCSWLEAAWTWLLVGATGFGGPAGQIAILHREVVERKGWLGEEEFLAALRLCMLLPGPEAQQLATYAGWRMHGLAGGLVAGTLFVLPGAVLVTALAWLHAAGQSLPLVAAAFAGTRPAVVALVVLATWRIGCRSISTPAGLSLAAAAAVAMALGVGFPLLVLAVGIAAAVLGWLKSRGSAAAGGDAGPPVGASARAIPGAGSVWRLPLVTAAVGIAVWLAAYAVVVASQPAGGRGPAIARLFTETTLLSLGGAYAVVPWALDESLARGWLKPAERFDALAMGEATPGPLILVVTFIGFLAGWKTTPDGDAAAGLAGAGVATLFAFIPSFAMVLSLAPVVRLIHPGSALDRAMKAVGCVVVAAIGLLAVRLAAESLFPGGRPAVLPIAVAAACGVALELGRVSTPLAVLGAAAIGSAAASFTHIHGILP